MNILTIFDELEKYAKIVGDFVVDLVTNPVFWIILVLFIIGVTLATYGSKDKDK